MSGKWRNAWDLAAARNLVGLLVAPVAFLVTLLTQRSLVEAVGAVAGVLVGSFLFALVTGGFRRR